MSQVPAAKRARVHTGPSCLPITTSSNPLPPATTCAQCLLSLERKLSHPCIYSLSRHEHVLSTWYRSPHNAARIVRERQWNQAEMRLRPRKHMQCRILGGLPRRGIEASCAACVPTCAASCCGPRSQPPQLAWQPEHPGTRSLQSFQALADPPCLVFPAQASPTPRLMCLIRPQRLQMPGLCRTRQQASPDPSVSLLQNKTRAQQQGGSDLLWTRATLPKGQEA